MKRPSLVRWLRRRNPAILIDWDAVQVRQAALRESNPALLAAIDQAQATIRDFLQMTGVDAEDQRDLYCVAVGICLADATARNLFNVEHLPTNLVCDVALSGVIPLIDDAAPAL